MRLEDRARRAALGLRHTVEAAEALERFHHRRERRQRTRQWGAVALAAILVVSAILLGSRIIENKNRDEPVGPVRSGGLILYSRWHPTAQHGSWFTVRPDGTGTRNLHILATCAVWWPDGSRILVTHDAAYGPGRPLRPASVKPDGSQLRPLNAARDQSLNLGCGDVSPDGTRLVLEGFNEHRRGVDGIYTVRASDGGELVRLTHNPYGSGDDTPLYSPDGGRVVFMREGPGTSPEGAGALFVMHSDGSALRRITPWGFVFLGYSWAPDGRWILFQRPYGELYLIHPDGTGLHRIPLRLPPGSGAQNPAWSPDGKMIAFSLARNGTADIYTIRSDGTGLRRVTLTRGADEQHPDWGRPGS
jgi:Tol biopolymer transport system component